MADKEVYRASCDSCEMKAKIRVSKPTVISVAEAHLRVTGHDVEIERVSDSTVQVVTESGVEEASGAAADD